MTLQHCSRLIVLAAAFSVAGSAPVLADDARRDRPIVIADGAVRDADPSVPRSTPDVAAKPPASERADEPMPIFVPRTSRGAPASRIGGASRAVGDSLVIRVLVPQIDEAALTLSEQPVLPWSLSRSTPHAVNFTLIDPERVEPLVDVTLPGPFEVGVHRIDLADYDARLEAGRRYHWFVAVVVDPDRRSADIVARGSIERVSSPAPLAAQIAAARPEDRAAVLAREGIWYDALETLHEQLPRDDARRKRDALLTQVGIDLDR